MPLVAVAERKFARGVDGPGVGGHTYDWREKPGSVANTRRIRGADTIMDLENALAGVYRHDAVLVAYVMRDADGAPLTHQPRINKGGLDWVLEQGFRITVEVLVADIDNPGKALWTDPAFEEAVRIDERVVPTAGVYYTRRGRRIVQPLTERLDVRDAEGVLKAWLAQLGRDGIAPDMACDQWNRLFHLPNISVAGQTVRSRRIDLSRMRPVRPPAPVALPGRGRMRSGAAVVLPPVDFDRELAPMWQELATRLGSTIRGAYQHERHALFLALSGALLRRVPAEQLPILIGTVVDLAGADREHARAAIDTVKKWQAQIAVTGQPTLASHFPVIADVLDTTFHVGRRHLDELAAAEPAPPSLAEAITALEDVIRSSPPGLTVIQAACGLGKTAAARRVALERAAKPYVTDKAEGLRAPVQSKTSISGPTTRLAEQVTADLRAASGSAKRLFGPLSVLREDGTPECRYHASAKPLAEGGQSIPWQYCEGRGQSPCVYRGTCAAYRGVDGPDAARIAVGTHGHLTELDGEAGKTGLLVIDEPPELLETVVITTVDLDIATRYLDYFEADFANGMRDALAAVTSWQREHAPLGELAPLVRALDSSPAEVLERVKAAIDDDREGSRSPPIHKAHLFHSRDDPELAEKLGAASRVLGAIHRALTSTTPVATRVEERDDERVLIVTASRDELAAAVRREGAVVVMDAGADLHLPILAKVVGYAPRFHRFTAADGAAIDRTLIRTRLANRRHWSAHGKVVLDAGVETALGLAVDWALEQPTTKKIGIITFRRLRLLFDAALGVDVADVWKKEKQAPARLKEARERLAPILARLPAPPALGHYGAMRGLDAWAAFDAVITLGDPWPNIADVQNDTAFLGLVETWEERAEAKCRAELEQAHGRLRTLHRTRPGRALHVGAVLPTGWRDVTLRRPPVGGRPRNESDMTADELSELLHVVGGRRAAAAALGCNEKTLARFLSGERRMSAAMAAALRAVAEGSAARETMEPRSTQVMPAGSMVH